MEKIGFIGAFDKTDLLMQTARIMTALNKKVIVIDTTINQKAKYIVPVINPTTSYITEFEGFDVAVGLYNANEIKEYLGIDENEELDYDIALIDIDSSKELDVYGIKNVNTKYFVTSFDLFSLKKGLEILSDFSSSITLKKILYTKTMSKEEDDYLNFLSKDYLIQWEDEKIYFPFEMGDQSANIENQRVSKLKFRNLSSAYKDSLAYVVQDILKDGVRPADIKHAMKNIDKI